VIGGTLELLRWLWCEHSERVESLEDHYGEGGRLFASVAARLESTAVPLVLRVRLERLEDDGRTVRAWVTLAGEPESEPFSVALEDLSGFDWGQA
jgi:hypothetical protein